MIALVTGAAGFIGSTLARRLLDDGLEVRGVDCLSDYYDPRLKLSNLSRLSGHPGFEFMQVDLAREPIEPLVDNVETVYHQAAQPGVRLSWSDGFEAYVVNNVLATQRLLEACVRRVGHPPRFVYASSSSVYGNATMYPTREATLPRPFSPYGVTKLAGEHLCAAYHENWGLPVVGLRYFTVYGPRQRPDMAFHRLIEAALDGAEFRVYGSGEQRRDFTYVEDVVDANLAAARAISSSWQVVNIGGGSAISLNDAIATVESLVDRKVAIRRSGAEAGDVRETGADPTLSRSILGWEPRMLLKDGLRAQIRWHLDRRRQQPGETSGFGRS